MAIFTTRCSLANTLISVPDFRRGVLDELGATAASMLMQVCNIQMTKIEMERYLDPVKDLVYFDRFNSIMKDLGYTPNLVGLDTVNLIMRIKDPIRCWETGQAKIMLTFWLVINTNGIRTFYGEKVLSRLFYILRSNATTATEVTNGTMQMTFDTEYPFRLVVRIPDAATNLIYENNYDIRTGLEITDRNPGPISESWTSFTNDPIQVINWNFMAIGADAVLSTSVIDLAFDTLCPKSIVAIVDSVTINFVRRLFHIARTGASADLEELPFRVVKFGIGSTIGATFSIDMEME